MQLMKFQWIAIWELLVHNQPSSPINRIKVNFKTLNEAVLMYSMRISQFNVKGTLIKVSIYDGHLAREALQVADHKRMGC